MNEINEAAILRLSDSWIYKVSVLADMVARQVTTTVQQVSGLNLSQWRVIAALADQPGRTASEVVDVTPMDKGIVSRAVSTLVERDFVERRSSKSDGRLAHLYLTQEGEAVYRRLVTAMDQSGASGRLSVDRDAQRRLIAILSEVIEQYKI